MHTFHFGKLWFTLGRIQIILICYLSMAPHLPTLEANWHFGDKISHAFSYFAITFWYVLLHKKHRHVRLFFSFFILGLVLEIIQYFLPHRNFDLWDLLANGAGGLLAYFLGKTPLNQFLVIIDRAIGRKTSSPPL